MLHFQASLIRHGLAVLDVAPQDPQMNRPAVARYPPVFIRLGPPIVIEKHARLSLTLRRKPAAHARLCPIHMRLGHLKFELRAGHVARNRGSPVVARAEVEPEPGIDFGFAIRFLGAPAIQSVESISNTLAGEAFTNNS
jgi:hypothetical protein